MSKAWTLRVSASGLGFIVKDSKVIIRCFLGAFWTWHHETTVATRSCSRQREA